MQMIAKVISSVTDSSLFIIWAFQLSLDPTAPSDDMGLIKGVQRSCPVEFKTRVPDTEIRHMMLTTDFSVAQQLGILVTIQREKITVLS
ncbi:hypothetical protein AZE42_02189 [Rhizopogon vesiculosus]|uniref:Uncharacterized protein n=1 Tax=Rhizopogon vesiculosus TaxID=180088 RepID=A0A1J8PUB3_9AGAM|nr:hypothetical protein AZE42_02189 [Rhizopogon vesiculosus]